MSGEVRTQSGTLSTDFLFTGEQRDSESALYYLRARYYDPTIGRLLTRDPFAGWTTAPQSQNRYAYVVNNPVRFIDPLGLECSAAPWDWDDCEDDLEEWVEDNVVEPAASAAAEFLSEPENVASVVQVVAGAGIVIGCGLGAAPVCGASYIIYIGASGAKVFFADSTHERIVSGVTGGIGLVPATRIWGKLLAGFSSVLDALADPTPVEARESPGKKGAFTLPLAP